MRMSLPSRAYGFVLVLLPILAGVLFALVLPSVARAAETGCSNEALRAEDPYSVGLPDCRAYEQVSPVEKSLADAVGIIGVVRAAPSGEALTFDSYVPLPVSVGSNVAVAPNVSARRVEGWLTQSLSPRTNPGALTPTGPEGVTEDLTQALVESQNEPPLASGAIEGRSSLYLRDNDTGSYRLLAQEQPGESSAFYFVDAASNDARIFFETTAPLLPGVTSGVNNLYEWHGGRLSVVDVLPQEGGVPASGAVAAGTSAGEGASHAFYLQNAISENGARVFFTDLGTGRIYVREPENEKTIAVSKGLAVWRAATPDGREVYYTEGNELYRFDVEAEAPKPEPLTSGAAGVLGVLGVGGGGSYVYFAAEGALARGAVLGGDNLYLWHEDAITFIARLQGEAIGGAIGDQFDWETHRASAETGLTAGPAAGGRSSRVSVDGRTLLFASQASLTSYDNAGHYELYLYDATTGRTVCVSCDPSGEPATSGAFLYLSALTGFAEPGSYSPLSLPRNLSADGSRVFFDTPEALVRQDTNGQMNVYEWEREGAGNCPAGRGGCLFLISTGQSSEPSYFAEASASGSDVFFFTRQSLVGQDTDELVDVYDARVGGGIAAQNSSAPTAPCLGEACRAAQNPAPALGVPVSQVFSGPGNLAPPVESKVVAKPKPKPVKCKKGFVKKDGKCVRKLKVKKSKAKKSKAKKASNNRTGKS